MKMRDITKEIGAATVDCHELSSLLWIFFGCSMNISKSEITFSKPGAPSLLQIVFSKKHSLKSVLCSPELSNKDIEQIKQKINDELLDQSQISIGREVLFSSFPVNGFFKFKNEMQILPVPTDAPKDVFLRMEHPFLLEFEYVASKDHWINSYRRNQKATRNSTVLALFLEGGIIKRESRAHGHWVLMPNAATGKQEYKILPEGYGYDGLKVVDTSFSRTDEFSPLTEIPDEEYYSRGRMLNTKPMEIPVSLSNLISKFWQLPIQRREQFFRAAYWYKQAHNLYLTSKSSSYLAAVMAIETLVEVEKNSAKCPTCNKPEGKGPTKKFREFLEKYAPFISSSENDQQIRAQLYELRSKLAHGGQIFLEDAGSSSVTMASTQATDELQKMERIFRFTRIALVNWLESHPSVETD